MLCALVSTASDGSLVFEEVTCAGNPDALVLQTQGEVGGSFFSIPLNEAPGLLAASLALIVVAWSIRMSRKAAD